MGQELIDTLYNKVNKFRHTFLLFEIIDYIIFVKTEFSENDIDKMLKDSKIIDWVFEDSLISRLIGLRQKARDAKMWDIADYIRGLIVEHGYTLKDTKNGTTAHKIN